LPERTINALYDAAMRHRVRNGTYRAALVGTEDEVTNQVANRDLKQPTTAGLLRPHAARPTVATRAPRVRALTSRQAQNRTRALMLVAVASLTTPQIYGLSRHRNPRARNFPRRGHGGVTVTPRLV
jgi:hypothetical protein